MRENGLPSEQESRIEWWRRLIFRQQSAAIPLTEFCRQMGITTRKFYYWRQRLRDIDAASSGRRVSLSGSSQPASAIARGTAASFVPVSIVSSDMTTQLEIELANGCAVRLTGPIAPDLLQAAISAAGQINNTGRGDH